MTSKLLAKSRWSNFWSSVSNVKVADGVDQKTLEAIVNAIAKVQGPVEEKVETVEPES